jgi:ABC-type Zn uptake system ZnuABC Zn-binding protein ZnuA
MRKINLFLCLALFVSLLSACSGTSANSTPPAGPKVMATESFLADIARNVAGTRLQVVTLIPPGVDPHEFEPRPQDITAIATSQVLIVNGLGYETWLKKTLENSGGQQLLVVATQGLAPHPDPTGEHPDGDPHMWMNPLNVITYVHNIRDGLIQADPAGKDSYTQNADAYIARLKDLDIWIKSQVSPLPASKRLLVTNHDALGYFAAAYGFKVVGAVIPGVSDAASPSARELAALIETIKGSAAPAIFLDVGENRALAEQIASETGVKVNTGLYVEGTSTADGPAATYIDMLKYDVTQIISALK